MEPGGWASYIGQSRSPIKVRFNEHLIEARLHRSDTGLGEHTIDFHMETDIKEISTNYRIQILTNEEHEADLRISESIQIRDNNPSMNSKFTSWNLTKYVL